MKFFYCPDCHKKGVRFALRSNKEDNWYCRYCDFFFFTALPAQMDRDALERLLKINPGVSFV